jgi:Tfp pilus assembly protein PilF
MKKLKPSDYIKGHKLLVNGKVEDFCDFLIDFYEDILCNCFFREIDKVIFKEELEILKNLNEINNIFKLNLVKGFVFLKNEMEYQAFDSLTKAIHQDKSKDILYYLRSEIQRDLFSNERQMKDAQTAVSINPSVRNLFNYASHLSDSKDDSDKKKALLYFEKAINLCPDFACAYNNQSYVLIDLKYFDLAIESFIKCVEIDNGHWAYIRLWDLLDNEKRDEEALNYAKIGALNHPKNNNYLFCISISTLKISGYEESLSLYQRYLAEEYESTTKSSRLSQSISRKEKLIIKEYLKWKNKAFCSEIFRQESDLLDKYMRQEFDHLEYYMSNSNNLNNEKYEIYLSFLHLRE